ncbi:MAG: hypothetical protein WCJ57_02810 [Candidatus Falkowbacteria bacterium]
MNENKNLSQFIPILDFNNPIFIELDQKIRPLLEKKAINLNRELQIRTMLYVNFNRYLNLLLMKIDEDTAIKALEELPNTPEPKQLELIATALNQPIDQIINNFMNLFSLNN